MSVNMNMNDITCVEVPDAPVRENRFLTFFGNEYSGIKSLQFVPMSRVIRKVNGVLQGDKPRSMNQKIVDDIQEAIKNGYPDKWLGSARVLKYLVANNKWEIMYVGKEQEVTQVEPEVPKAMKAHDGTWRAVPTKGFQKGPREWRLSIAFVDRNNEPRATSINGKTKLDVVNTLFEPSIVSWMNDYVLTLPFADPADIPAPPAPVVEKVYSQQELDQVQPLDPKVFERMSVAEHKKRYLFDPLYQVAFDKMNDLEEKQRAQAAERQRRLDKDAELKKMREQFLKDEADEARKGRGVGTIL